MPLRAGAHLGPLASLNHSHIAQIHGLEEADGPQFLVLELVDGENHARATLHPVTSGAALVFTSDERCDPRSAKRIRDSECATRDSGLVIRDSRISD